MSNNPRPSMAIFLSFPPAANKSHRPSGENTVLVAPSVPSRATAVDSLNERLNNCVVLARRPLNTSVLPSGDNASAVRPGRWFTRSLLAIDAAGSTFIDKYVSSRGGVRDPAQSRPTTIPTVIAVTAAPTANQGA